MRERARGAPLRQRLHQESAAEQHRAPDQIAGDRVLQERQRRAEEEAERQRSGKKRRGKQPGPISDVPDDKAQTSFTDPELKMMPQSNKGWDYATNAQASVDGMFQIIVACFVTAAANDKQQAIPLAEATRDSLQRAGIETPKDESGQQKKIPATLDNGFFSEEAVDGMQQRGFDPNSRDEAGQVALFLSLREGAFKVAAALLASPQLQVDAANAAGETPKVQIVNFTIKTSYQPGQAPKPDGTTTASAPGTAPAPPQVAKN